jgi:sugar lactone lactonase YvrE
MRRCAMVAAVVVLLGTVTMANAGVAGTVPGTAGFPESIAVVPGSSTFFVSSFLTGAVVRGTAGGSAQPFLPAGSDGRTSAAGLHVDARHRLFVLTGASEHLQIFNAVSGHLQADFAAVPRAGTNLNDLAITRRGDVYISDFGNAGIYRLSARQIASRRGSIVRWLSPPAEVAPNLASGGNFNGIAATPDGRYLLVGQTGNGALYRINLATRSIVAVRVSGGSLLGSDGFLLARHTLYVVTHQNGIAKVHLNANFSSGQITGRLTDPALDFPTSIAALRGQLVVTNGLKPDTASAYALTAIGRAP